MNSICSGKARDCRAGRSPSTGIEWTITAWQSDSVVAIRLFVGSLAFVLLLSLSSAAGIQTAPSLPAEVEVRIEAEPKTGTVGDLIRIDLDIILPVDCQLEIPQLENQVGDFVIIDFFPGPLTAEDENSPKSEKSQGNGLRHHRARVIASVYKTGNFEFPPIGMILKTGEGNEISFSSPPVNIEIRSVLNKDDQSLKDLKQQAEIPESARWLRWLLLSVAVLILAAIVRRFWKRHRGREMLLASITERDPLEAAEEELRVLLAEGYPDHRGMKRFYVILSEIVKRILEAGYGIQTAERTTSEIMDALGQNPAGALERLEQIESFLVQCDMVKFAKHIPLEEEHESTTRAARQILQQAKKAVFSRQ